MPLVEFKYYDVDQTGRNVNFLRQATSNISLPKLVLSALTVGRPNVNAVLAHGRYSVMECMWRSAMVLSNVSINRGANGLQHYSASQAFKQLDPSEKGAVTFFIGGVFTKIVAESFGIPTLYHLDTVHHYHRFIGPNLPTVSMRAGGNSRPDFIGPYAPNIFGVFESKGRSQSSDDPLRMSAKEQTRRINQINQNDPFCRIGCITSFGGRILTVDVVDPADSREDAINIETKGADFKEPYRITDGFIKATDRKSVTHVDTTYIVGKLEEADLEFGVSRDLLDVIERGSNEDMELEVFKRGLHKEVKFPESISDRINTDDNTQVATALDGHYVKLGKSWEAIMTSYTA